MKAPHSSRLVAILDDDKSVRCALKDLVEAERMAVLCFGAAEPFLKSEARHEVGCLIADIHMPRMSGIELQAKLHDEQCLIPMIFLTGRGDIPSTVNAMKLGAVDFFTKPFNAVTLLKSVEKAFEVDSTNRQGEMEREKLITRYESLTPREREVLHLLASGLLNKQAAFELGITEYTVQFHRGHIMRKLEADSFASLVRLADKIGPHLARELTHARI
jgi:FixJ family two-component response regulator